MKVANISEKNLDQFRALVRLLDSACQNTNQPSMFPEEDQYGVHAGQTIVTHDDDDMVAFYKFVRANSCRILHILTVLETLLDNCADPNADTLEFRENIINVADMPGIASIAKERLRQINEEGYTVCNDAQNYEECEMAMSAACYALQAAGFSRPDHIRADHPRNIGEFGLFPWPARAWKPVSDPIRNLEKAGALIAAEIDRLKAMSDAES